MSKAFTKETGGGDGNEPEEQDALPAKLKNYMTPPGFAALQEELRRLLYEERPEVVKTVSWAAGNGDRSENGDYIYGKKRLREIDKRVRYLNKRLETAEVVEPRQQKAPDQVFFGATVTYAHADDTEHTVTLVGVDETDTAGGRISWISPVARALMKSRVGDCVELRTPAGSKMIEVLMIKYKQAPG